MTFQRLTIFKDIKAMPNKYSKTCKSLSDRCKDIFYIATIVSKELEIGYCGNKYFFDKSFFVELKKKFGKLSTVKLGAPHTAPPKDSLGYWLKENRFDYGKTTHIATVLDIEGYLKIGKLGRAIFLNFSELSKQIG